MNVLLITADQWRGECLSSLDHPHVKTPHLDALAADGTSFKRHFAQATPCGPSRACLYTGMYMHNHRSLLNGTPLDARHSNVALEARKSGYKPAVFGYTDVSLDPRSSESGDHSPGGYEGVLPGMDPVGLLVGDWGPWLENLKAKGYQLDDDLQHMFKPQPAHPESEGKGKTFSPARFSAEDSSAAYLTDEVIEYLSVQQKEPWFVHLSLFSPHPPFIAPEPYHKMYEADDMPLPVRCETAHQEGNQHPWLQYYLSNQGGTAYTHGADPRGNISLPEHEQRQIRATYFGMMSEVDSQIGRLVNHLKKISSYENTLIIFTSDHGEYLGDHWMYAKFGYFNQTFHIPLVIRDPSSKANAFRGSVVDAFTESVDVMPTILAGIGADIPMQCDGQSMLPFCRGAHPAIWRKEYHAEFDLRSSHDIDETIPLGLNAKQCAVNVICDDRYKYVHFNGLPPLLFDLKLDPNEFHDRSGDVDYQGIMLVYAQKMLTWRMDHADPALTNFHLEDDGSVRVLQK